MYIQTLFFEIEVVESLNFWDGFINNRYYVRSNMVVYIYCIQLQKDNWSIPIKEIFRSVATRLLSRQRIKKIGFTFTIFKQHVFIQHMHIDINHISESLIFVAKDSVVFSICTRQNIKIQQKSYLRNIISVSYFLIN